MSLPGAGETEPTTTSFHLSSDRFSQSQTAPSSSTSTPQPECEDEPTITIIEPLILTSASDEQFLDDNNNNTETITDFEVIKADNTDNSDVIDASVVVTELTDHANTIVDSANIPTSIITETGANDNDQTSQIDTITIIPADNNNECVLDAAANENATKPNVVVVVTQCVDYIADEYEPLASASANTTTTNQTNEKTSENSDLHKKLVEQIIGDLYSDNGNQIESNADVSVESDGKQQTVQVSKESVEDKGENDSSVTVPTQQIKAVTVDPSAGADGIEIVERTVKFVESESTAGDSKNARESGDDREIKSILKTNTVTPLDAKEEALSATKSSPLENKYFDYSLYREASSSPPPKPPITYRWEDVKREKEKVRSNRMLSSCST